MDEGVDEWAEGRLAAEGGFGEGVAVRGEDAGPEVEGVDVLPVVDGFVGVLYGVSGVWRLEGGTDLGVVGDAVS